MTSETKDETSRCPHCGYDDPLDADQHCTQCKLFIPLSESARREWFDRRTLLHYMDMDDHL